MRWGWKHSSQHFSQIFFRFFFFSYASAPDWKHVRKTSAGCRKSSTVHHQPIKIPGFVKLRNLTVISFCASSFLRAAVDPLIINGYSFSLFSWAEIKRWMHSIWVIPHTWWVGFRKKICKPIQICHDSYYTSYSTSFTTQMYHLSRMCAEARCEERKTENQELWNRRHKTLEGQIKASLKRSLARKFRPRQIPSTSVCGLAEPIQQQLIFLSVPSHIHLGVKSVSQHISRFLKRAESRTNGNNVFSLPLQTPRQLTAVPRTYLAPLVTLQFSPQKDGREGEVFSIQGSNTKK